MAQLRQILIVEDDPEDREIAGQACVSAGLSAEISFVEDGKLLMELLQKLQAERRSDAFPDLILLDLNLPYIDGREALQRIKQDPGLRHIPVIILTTSNSKADIRTCYELGANSFISKPRRFDELVKTMQTLERYWEFAELPRSH